MDSSLLQKVERRAYELFLARGGVHGYHIEDWLQAEKEIIGKPAVKAPEIKTAKPIKKAVKR